MRSCCCCQSSRQGFHWTGTMPWDQNHSRMPEAQKFSHRLSPGAFRSGCYKRAITILQNENGDYSGRDATAASLYRLLTSANRKMASQAKSAPSSPGQRETAPSQHQNPSAQEKLQDKLQIQVIKEQLRRERQQQRHEQNKQLWQRRHEEKIRLRQQDLAARTRQLKEVRKEQLHKLEQQQQKLVQQLEDHKQISANQNGADPVSVASDVSAAPHTQLLQVQQLRSKAEVQLALARQASEHMSRRAASIEPEDGECSPSPSAMQQAKTAAKPWHGIFAVSAMAKGIITWVEGLKGLSGIVIVFNHLRMCYWPESHDAVLEDGHFYLVQLPFVSLICAGNLAVRLYFVLSGFSLCYRPLQLLDENRKTLVYQRTSRSLQSRFWRLLVPSAVASAVSLVMAQLGAFTHSKTVCRAFLDTTPVATGVAADSWLWIKDTFLNVWIVGKHHFHDSLWCMKILLVGSYLMYLLVALRVEARLSCWLWTAVGCALLSPAVASIGATDLTAFVFGGIVAFLEVNHAAAKPSTTPLFKRTTRYAAWFAVFILSLLLGSYPSGEANAPWCSWMYTLVRSVVGIENARQAMVWWMNVSAILICICISHLPYVQNALSLPCITYLGKTSFALFLLHPLILRSLGGHLFSMLSHWHGIGYDVAALTMAANTLCQHTEKVIVSQL